MGLASNAGAQQRAPYGPPPWANDTIGESDVYPVGDAVGVYRAVLDLLYVDGKERPSIIVLWDTAQRTSAGPCANLCKEQWLHKSKMDTATILAFARQSWKRPRIVDFGYGIPIARVSNDVFERVRHEGHGYLADLPPEKVGPGEAFWAGFRRRYPRAWGYVVLSRVGFNPQHTEALIGVYQNCGENCRADEVIFLKRYGKQWRVIERIPERTEVYQTAGNLRYRGPAVEKKGESQIVAIDASGSQPRAESDDAGNVYRAVLDRLYSFYGESPRSIVLTEMRAGSSGALPNHRSRIDSSTLASYNLFAQVRDAVHLRIGYRLPISWVSDTALTELERSGAGLAKAAAERFEQEQAPLWHGFHAKYPGAWGYASLGRVAFNPGHTQALVFTRHFCGTGCVNADTWFLERKGDSWYVVERMPREQELRWTLDGLRYLGPGVDPKWYRPRRIHGVFTDAETGKPLPKLQVEVNGPASSKFIETDAQGRYSIENLPLGGFALMAKCPARLGGKWVGLPPIEVSPGLDSTRNFKVDFTMCPQH